MQIIDIHSPSVLGGRRSSPKFRETLAIAENFEGLPEGVTHFDLLKLVKRAGKEVGFTTKMIALLEYYIIFTKEQDWAEGARPIVYQSIYKTALDFGVGERQIQKLEQALFDVGALTWNDSGNHKRYGTRSDETGDIIYAYGVDLSPLAHLRSTLEAKYHEKLMRDAAWMETKRQISWHRARIRAYAAELIDMEYTDIQAIQYRYDEIALPIRAHMGLETLLEMLEEHKALLFEVESLTESLAECEQSCALSQECSSTDALKGVHIYSTTKNPSDKSDTSSHPDISFQKSVAESTEQDIQDRDGGKSGDDASPSVKYPDVTLKQILNAASNRFLDKMPIEPRPMNERDFVEAAFRLLPDLGIHRSAWGEACDSLGRLAAAICIVIIDQKMNLPENQIRNPGGYLRAMVKRAKSGELNLHASIFGLLKRGERLHAE